MLECAEWARELFEEYYVRRPTQLVHTFPQDAKDSAGQPFWQGTRRPPSATPFDATNSVHGDFIVSSTFLRAFTLGLISSEFKPEDLSAKREAIIAAANSAQVSSWTPCDNVKIAYDPEKEKDSNQTASSAEDDAHMAALMAKLPSQADLGDWKMNVLDFEKDDDSNFHIDFVYSAANLRAVAYEIPVVSRLQAKLIAGKIIPAIVTTTAAMAGLVCLELFKLALGKKDLSVYKNTYANLAIPVFNMADAMPPGSYKYKDHTYSTWDSVKIKKGDLTTKQLIAELTTNHNIKPFTISYPLGSGMKNIYMSFGDYSRELDMKVSDLVRELLAAEKRELHPLQNCFKLFITPDDDDDDDMMMDVAPDDEAQDTFPPVWLYFKN